jgi:NAD(P)H-hydrate epimerase
MKAASNLPALSTNQMVEVDRLMIEEWQILLIQMMENAGRNLAELARRFLGGKVEGRYLVVMCGTGNNGGGGLVAARHLHNWGARVHVILVGDPARLKQIPAHQWRIAQKMGLPASDARLEGADLILDAIIGYGMSGSPRPQVAEWIERANACTRPILALDAPTGLDTTSGIPAGICIQATATLTLALPKTGLLQAQAQPWVGDLYLADISVPPELYASASLDIQLVSPFQTDTIVKLT